MYKIKKETLEILDEINLLEVCRQISLGNLVRAIEFLANIFEKVIDYLKYASEKLVPATDVEKVQELKVELGKPEKRKKSNREKKLKAI